MTLFTSFIFSCITERMAGLEDSGGGGVLQCIVPDPHKETYVTISGASQVFSQGYSVHELVI